MKNLSLVIERALQAALAIEDEGYRAGGLERAGGEA